MSKLAVTIGTIRIDNVNGEFLRLTIDTDPYLDRRFEQVEAQGYTLAEALLGLHEQVEALS
jgi:hypothetical protein